MIKIGKKTNQYSGFVFYPYIKILEVHLPVKFSHVDKSGKSIFKKNEKEK
jgi:hypothetical protein